MIETLPLEKLSEKARTLYEAVEAIARRARQINSMRKAQMEAISTSEEESEELFDEIDFNTEPQVYERQKKPIRQAMEELMEGKLRLYYPKPENDEMSA